MLVIVLAKLVEVVNAYCVIGCYSVKEAGGGVECLLCYWLLLCLEEAGGGECWRNCCSIGWRLVWTQDTTQWKSGQYLIHGSVKR